MAKTSSSVIIYKLQSGLVFLKPFIKPFLVVFGIYCAAMISIWLAGVSWQDDMGRAVWGYAWDVDYSRYTQSFLSRLINTNNTLFDISPLPQIIAMVFLSISSVIVTYVFCGKKIKYLPLVLSTFIGLNPFIAECWLYKFDAPGMAFSLLAGVLPIIFWGKIEEKTSKWWKIGLLSVASLLLMWTSYQAASGVFLVLVLGAAMSDFFVGKPLPKIIKKVFFFALAYIVAALLFRLLPSSGYRSTEMLGAPEMVGGLIVNIKTFLKNIYYALNGEWKLFGALALACCVVCVIAHSKKRGAQKTLDGAVMVFFVAVATVASYGVLYLLKAPPMSGRSFMGIGVVLAIMGIVAFRDFEKSVVGHLLYLPSILLLYSFVVFLFALGNGLKDQERYLLFRNEVLLDDLSHIYKSNEEVDKTTLVIIGDIGKSAVMTHVNVNYPIVNNIVGKYYGLGENWWGTVITGVYNDRPQYVELVENGGECDAAEVVMDTYYHTIMQDSDDTVCVHVKQGGVIKTLE